MRRLTPSGKHCAAHTRTHPECERRARTVVVRVKTHQLGQLRRQLRVRLGWESTEEGADSVYVMQCGGLALSMLDVQAAGPRAAAHHHGAPEAHAARAAAAPRRRKVCTQSREYSGNSDSGRPGALLILL